MTPRRARPRRQEASLFNHWDQPLLRWDRLPEKVRQEALQLLTQLFHPALPAKNAVLAGKEVGNE